MRINITNSYDNNAYDSILKSLFDVASKTLNLNNSVLNIVLVDNDTIQTMNRTYRQKDYATDVLSFPDGTLHHLGDVIISIDKCKAQALEYKHSFERELAFLSIHGLLHCLGYDHKTNHEEQQMNQLAQSILEQASYKRMV
ncbi:MAG: rRNA maturation RNase YbeY [Candidatus Izimaplasma sp.]|nr:rRNA maturation RNase YbeY [Candidatus Izimaplasma bacterium]